MAQTLSSLTNTIAVDGTGKLPTTLMPDSVVGSLNYQGTWNAATNTPHLQNGTGTKGFYYKVATQGTTDIGGIDFWNLGDVISYNGTTWDRIDGGINEVVAGPPGPQGPPGPSGSPGNNGPTGPTGQTLYSWFAYANSADGLTGFTTGTWTNQTYLGIATNRTSPIESNNPSDYSWAKMQGPPGPQGTTGPSGEAGPQGNALYTWIAYADNATGTSGFITGTNTGQAYIGIANNKTTSVESTNPAEYTWSKIQGEDGVPGSPGANGQPTYTWFAYANSADGTVGFTTGAWTNQTYLGLAVNKLTQVESTNPADYFWSKIQGNDGATGQPGVDGTDGKKSAFLVIYKWANTLPSVPSQAFTYTWATGSVSAYPSGWTSVAPAAPASGYTLYALTISLSDNASATTTSANWSSSQVQTYGYRQDGSIGLQGGSHRIAYIVTTSAAPPSVTSGSGDVLPTNVPAGQVHPWSSTAYGTLNAGEFMYQTDGIYTPGGNVVWAGAYLSNLKVGNLSAITTNTGNLTVSGDITAGNPVRTGHNMSSGAGALLQSGGPFALGNTTTNLAFDGTTLALNGNIIGTDNINNGAITGFKGTSKSSGSGSYLQSIPVGSSYTVISNSQLFFPAKVVTYDAKIMIVGSFWPKAVAVGVADFDWQMQIQRSPDGVSNWTSFGTWDWRQTRCVSGDQDLPFVWTQDESLYAADLATAQANLTAAQSAAAIIEAEVAGGDYTNEWQLNGLYEDIAYWTNQVNIIQANVGVNRAAYYMRLVCKHTSSATRYIRGFSYSFTEFKK